MDLKKGVLMEIYSLIIESENKLAIRILDGLFVWRDAVLLLADGVLRFHLLPQESLMAGAHDVEFGISDFPSVSFSGRCRGYT